MSPGPALTAGARVLVRLPSWLGDFVMSEPLVRALHERLASGRLSLLGRAAHLELLEGRFPETRRLALEAGGVAAWRGHDVALLATGSFRSAWRAWRAGIPRRAGVARDGRGWLLTDTCTPARERGATPPELGRRGRGRRFLPRPLERGMAELAGLLGVPVRDMRPRLEVRPTWRAEARARRARLGLTPEEPYLLANVGARSGSAKGYPPALWNAALGELARRTELPVLLVAGPGEEVSLAEAHGASKGLHALRAPLAGLTELAALCAEARLVLGADSGPRHVARAVGASQVCVVGPTDPRHTAGERGSETWLARRVPCGPCHRERCPLAGAEAHACMTGIAPERLVSAALAALAARPIG